MILSFWATDEGKAKIPAVVHVDGSCRVQSVTAASNPLYYELLTEFEKLTGVGVVMNTSFNLKGDAIVESPRDANPLRSRQSSRDAKFVLPHPHLRPPICPILLRRSSSRVRNICMAAEFWKIATGRAPS